MLTALDFPFCYLLVKYLGTERIGEFESFFSSVVCGVVSMWCPILRYGGQLEVLEEGTGVEEDYGELFHL